jgi:DNA-directed RNA polymerase subunit RPC12/RpoP
MAQTFRCPACGASLDYDGDDDPAVTCAYCNSTVLVPEELRPDRQAPQSSIPLFGTPMTLNLGGLTGTIATLKNVKELARNGREAEAATLYSETFGASRQDAEALVASIAAGRSVAVTNTNFGLPLRVVSGAPSQDFSSQSATQAADFLLNQVGITRQIRRKMKIMVALIVIFVLAMAFLALSGTIGRFL